MRDKTAALAKHVRPHLRPGESVLAAVAVALHGTGAARMAGAASGDGSPSFKGDNKLAASKAEAAKLGIAKGFQFYLVLTSLRLLLVRRSAFGRSKEVVFEVALDALEGIRASKGAQAVFVQFGDERKDLRLETPKPFKFLPPVYERLPALLAEAKSA